MRKIPTLYRRDPDDRAHVIPGDVTPGCEWVLAGEGRPTRKFDGTCVMRDDAGLWWARRTVKPGKAAPPDWREVEHDPTTGIRVGWEPIVGTSFEGPWREAVGDFPEGFASGTYELFGPKINGNPERAPRHYLIRHGFWKDFAAPDTPPETLMEVCRRNGWEGIVWHHPDGRMAKLKVRDMPKVTR